MDTPNKDDSIKGSVYKYNTDLINTIEDVKKFINEMGITLVVLDDRWPSDKNPSLWKEVEDATSPTV